MVDRRLLESGDVRLLETGDARLLESSGGGGGGGGSPVVTDVAPSSGSSAGGTEVTITGTGFTGATDVLFGATSAASFEVNSDTTIFAITPPHAAGTVTVTVLA